MRDLDQYIGDINTFIRDREVEVGKPISFAVVTYIFRRSKLSVFALQQQLELLQNPIVDVTRLLAELDW